MEQIQRSIDAVVRALIPEDVTTVELSRPRPEFGDFSTNVALTIAKLLKKNPREIAQRIADELQKSGSEWLESAEVAGPGFINLRLTQPALLQLLDAEPSKRHAGKKIVIETNNPNPFKDIHIGHAMNAIVSDTIANLLEAGGAEVHRVSYHGDVGLHVAKSMWAIREELEEKPLEKLEAIAVADRPVKLREWYATGATAYKDEAFAKQEIEDLVQDSPHYDDPTLQKIYDTCKQWSFDYFDEVFAKLGSKPVEKRYLESDSSIEGRKVVEAHIGDVFEKSDGAIVFPGEKYDLHTRVFIAGRGTTLYEARDLGLMELKDQDYHPDASYIVTAEEQKEYFRVVLKAASMISPQLGSRTINISTGMVKLTTGKMSSRTGDAINISWLFDTLRQAVLDRGAKDDAVEQSVLGAVRYWLLKNRLTSDSIFDVEQSVALEGNTGPYLQYAHARARSILRKSKVSASLDDAELTADERALVSRLTEYNEVLHRAIGELMPHHITTYLFELCKDFNSFYEHNRVIGDPRENVRIMIVKKYAEVLHAGLQILGIHAPEKM